MKTEAPVVALLLSAICFLYFSKVVKKQKQIVKNTILLN